MSTPTPETPAAPAKTWAVVELFGKERVAGAISEHEFGGEKFTRIDVPEVTVVDRVDGHVSRRTIQAHTKLFGGKAIFSICLVDEATALTGAHVHRHLPLRVWDLKRQLVQMPLHERRALLAIEAPALPEGSAAAEGHGGA